MPHDKKGRLIEAGDYLKFGVYTSRPDGTHGPALQIGRACAVLPGSTTCNVVVTYRQYPQGGPEGLTPVNAHEAEIVLKGDGTEPQAETTAVPDATGA